jgi:hypothetical protein
VRKISQERDALKRERPNDTDFQIERSLWARYLMDKEDTILGLVDTKLRRMFNDDAVVSLIFDGLLLWADCSRQQLDEVQTWLDEEHDWKIALLEKPHHGLPFVLPETLREANALLGPRTADEDEPALV